MQKLTPRVLVFITAFGLVLSAVALFLIGLFSMGFALQEPVVVISLLVAGPVLSLTTWIVLNVSSGSNNCKEPELQKETQDRWSSPLGKLFLVLSGALLSLPVFVLVLLVESQFPGERYSDVFGPFYSHPYLPLGGGILCLIGILVSVVLYKKFKKLYLAIGFAFGCASLGLLLIFAK